MDEPWNPTHVMTVDGEPIPVMCVPVGDGWACFTEAEWTHGLPADWEIDGDGFVWFGASPAPVSAREVRVERIHEEA